MVAGPQGRGVALDYSTRYDTVRMVDAGDWHVLPIAASEYRYFLYIIDIDALGAGLDCLVGLG